MTRKKAPQETRWTQGLRALLVGKGKAASLAANTGITPIRVSNLKRGLAYPTPVELFAIEAELKLEPRWVLEPPALPELKKAAE